MVGLLDIAKCLYDAISVLEKVQEDTSKSPSENYSDITSMFSSLASNGNNSVNNQLIAMQSLIQQIFGETLPTLRSILMNGKAFPSIKHTKNIRDASLAMTEAQKGLLVLDEDEDLVGIITPKDILCRLVNYIHLSS